MKMIYQAHEKLSLLLALCEGNPPITGRFTLERGQGCRDFGVFCVVSLNTLLNIQFSCMACLEFLFYIYTCETTLVTGAIHGHFYKKNVLHGNVNVCIRYHFTQICWSDYLLRHSIKQKCIELNYTEIVVCKAFVLFFLERWLVFLRVSLIMTLQWRHMTIIASQITSKSTSWHSVDV